VKLVMTLLVRDEQDILAANLDFHLQQGLDFFIITDNLSVDGTRDIIERYVSAGVAQYIYEDDDDFAQHRWVTRMARIAAVEHRADWVINSDADEFWLTNLPAQNLKDALKSVPTDVQALLAGRSNFIPLAGAPLREPVAKMVIRERESKNPLGEPLPPKLCHRGLAEIEVEQGNHAASSGGAALQGGLSFLHILHYPIRSYRQFENKIAKGGAAYSRNLELPNGLGRTWRELYQVWLRGELRAYYDKMILSPAAIEQGLKKGDLVLDRTVAEMLDRYRKQGSATGKSPPHVR
jgi:hypothetical protein